VVSFPNCKINLGLYILQKRTDGFHDLETIFYPIGLQDGLEIIADAASTGIQITVTGIEIKTQPTENICFKAYHLLKKDFPELPSVKIHLHKTIPAGAGLGGGSADGAFTLLLLNKKFSLALDEPALLRYALELGSDCPFFIKNKPAFATGRGEVLKEIELDLSAWKMVIVNPAIHINTAWAFSKINPSTGRKSLMEVIRKPVSVWRDELKNDFEDAVFSEHRELKLLKDQFYAKGAAYASMSGSGSTIYGLFDKSETPQLDLPSHYFVRHI
jgi:4-diphosphocytidyl-2-C-methyl-D-erythritol kinase